MSELAAKKKLLIAESEVYRELLKHEIRNFKIYGQRTQRRLNMVQTYLPMLMSSLPFVTSLFGRKRRFTVRKLGSLLFFGWKAYNQFGGVWRNRYRRSHSETHTSADDYLAKRI